MGPGLMEEMTFPPGKRLEMMHWTGWTRRGSGPRSLSEPSLWDIKSEDDQPRTA